MQSPALAAAAAGALENSATSSESQSWNYTNTQLPQTEASGPQAPFSNPSTFSEQGARNSSARACSCYAKPVQSRQPKQLRHPVPIQCGALRARRIGQAASFHIQSRSAPQNIAAGGNNLGPYAASAINSLSNVTITNANLTASEIPALNYFPATNTVNRRGIRTPFSG